MKNISELDTRGIFKYINVSVAKKDSLLQLDEKILLNISFGNRNNLFEKREWEEN